MNSEESNFFNVGEMLNMTLMAIETDLQNNRRIFNYI